MSDSEDSIVSLHDSEKSTTRDETIEAISNRNGDKLEEFQEQLQSMMVSHSTSEEEEQPEEGDNANEKKIIGRLSYSLILNIIENYSPCSLRIKINFQKIKFYINTRNIIRKRRMDETFYSFPNARPLQRSIRTTI